MKKRILPFMTLILLTSLSFAQPHTILVTVPDTAEVVYIAGTINNWSEPGDTMTLVSTNPKVYSYVFDMVDTSAAKAEYKFLSGPYWKYEQKQAANFVFGVDSNTAVVDTFKAVYHKDQADSVTIEVLVPAEVYELNLTGNFNGWDPTANPMEKVDSSANGKEFVLKIFTLDTTALAFKFVAGPGWPYEQVAGDFIYFNVGGVLVVDDFKKIFDPNAVGNITINVTAPAGTDQVWLIGSFNNWDPETALQATKNQDGTFTAVIEDVADIEFKCYSFNDWPYEEAIDDAGNNVPNRVASFITGPAFDITVAFWKEQYEEPTAVNDYETAKNLIYARNGSVVVEGVVEKVSVFDVQGRMVQEARVKGTFTSKMLGTGVYIIRVDNKVKKVLIP